MSEKLYFREDEDDFCYTAKTIKKQMIEDGVDKLEVFEAKEDTNSGYFFCKHYGLPTEQNEETCGKKFCDFYEPANGVNGRCTHKGKCYTPTNKSRTLKIKTNETTISNNQIKS